MFKTILSIYEVTQSHNHVSCNLCEEITVFDFSFEFYHETFAFRLENWVVNWIPIKFQCLHHGYECVCVCFFLFILTTHSNKLDELNCCFSSYATKWTKEKKKKNIGMNEWNVNETGNLSPVGRTFSVWTVQVQNKRWWTPFQV